MNQLLLLVNYSSEFLEGFELRDAPVYRATHDVFGSHSATEVV